MLLRPSLARASESPLADFLDSAGLHGGLCVMTKAKEPSALRAIAAHPARLVQALARTEAEAEELREALGELVQSGRVSVSVHAGPRLPYAGNLLNLLLAGAGAEQRPEPKEAFRALAPGGILLWETPQHEESASCLEGAGFREVRALAQPAGWLCARKPRPAVLDEWTHWRHGPEGTAVSAENAGVPEGLQWVAGPTWPYRDRKRGAFAALAAGGRLYYVTDENKGAGAPQFFLQARDAFNGLLLWHAALEGEFQQQALVASEREVYVQIKKDAPLSALDAATGRELRKYEEAGQALGGAPHTLLLVNETLLLAGPKALGCVDRADGRILWRAEGETRSLVYGGGWVYRLQRKGTLEAFALRDGARRWAVERAAQALGLAPTLVCHADGVLVFAGGKGNCALAAEDGALLWTYALSPPSHGGSLLNALPLGGRLWVHLGGKSYAKGDAWVGLNPRTGKEEERIVYREGKQRCHLDKATQKFILAGTMDFVDWKAKEHLTFRGARNNCRIGHLPANGLLYTFPHGCGCYPGMLRGVLAMTEAIAAPEEDGPRLVKGPAFEAPLPALAVPQAPGWPLFRRDAARGAAAPEALPEFLAVRWKAELTKPSAGLRGQDCALDPALDGALSAPVLSGGLAFAALPDRHALVALDAESGALRWTFRAGGRIDSPPALHEGYCLFGSRDGWLYCLQAADGALRWRFRAAPRERRIVAFGQVESAWPIAGSVLPAGKGVYAVAGRTTNTDEGMRILGLDLATGSPLWEKALPAEGEGFVGGADLLSSDGQAVYLDQYGFDLATGAARRSRSYASATGFLGFLDNVWYRQPLSVRRVANVRSTGSQDLRSKGSQESVQMLVRDGGGNWTFREGSGGEDARPGQLMGRPAEEGTWKAWKVPVALRVKAMLKAGPMLAVSGRLEDGEARDELWLLDAASGAVRQKLPLAAPAVYDGLAAAGGRLYLSCQDGTLFSLGAP